MSEEDRGSKPPGESDAAPPMGEGATPQRPTIDDLVSEYEDLIFAFCMRQLRNRELAEDAAQKTFLHAQRDLEQLRGRAHARAWLLAIAHNRCVELVRQHLRDRSRLDASEATLESVKDAARTPFERAKRAQLLAALEDCVDHLSPDTLTAVMLRFKYEMSYEEIAAALGESANTLQVRVARGLKKLRECMRKKGWDGE